MAHRICHNSLMFFKVPCNIQTPFKNVLPSNLYSYTSFWTDFFLLQFSLLTIHIKNILHSFLFMSPYFLTLCIAKCNPSSQNIFPNMECCCLPILQGATEKFFLFLFLFFVFLGPHPWHVEVPRPGVQLELQLPAYATATATPDLSHVCNLHHSSWQRQIINPLSKPRDQTLNLMVPSQILFCCATTGTPGGHFYYSCPHSILFHSS